MQTLATIIGIVGACTVILFCLGMAIIAVGRHRQKKLDFDEDDKIV